MSSAVVNPISEQVPLHFHYLTSNHSVVLLSNRGKAIDLDEFWEKLSGLIDNHAED